MSHVTNTENATIYKTVEKKRDLQPKQLLLLSHVIHTHNVQCTCAYNLFYAHNLFHQHCLSNYQDFHRATVMIHSLQMFNEISCYFSYVNMSLVNNIIKMNNVITVPERDKYMIGENVKPESSFPNLQKQVKLLV